MSDGTYHLWLRALRPRSLTDGVLVVDAPAGAESWVRRRFGSSIERAAATVLGPEVRVELSEGGEAPPDGAPARAARRTDVLNPKYTFEQFVIGDTNRFAHAAALAVAELPGQAYNPLFLYGPPGTGKTHLLHAIANYVRSGGDGATVRYTTVEAFTNDFLGALRSREIDAFKARHRAVDVLLIDDVQFLEAKARTEEEFFHTFNALYESGSQLVLTSDRLPRDLDALEERLRERFGAGLVADVATPDLATRLTILRKRAHHDGLDLADEAPLHVIATRIQGNVRELEGALIRVVAYASLTGRALDADLTSEVLATLYPGPAPGPRTVHDVQLAACAAFGLSLAELVSPARGERLTWPRQAAMYLARELTQESLPAIGRAFGGRNHTTVLHACRRACQRMESDPRARETVDALSEHIRTR